MGRRGVMVEKTKAYIAGFLDGDGSIFFQLVFRKGYKLGYQIRASVVFYQKTSQSKILRWLKHKLRAGYLRDRNDGISEYTIVGLRQVKTVLEEVEPYLILKKRQAKLAIKIATELECLNSFSKSDLIRIAKEVDRFGKLNYSKRRTNTVLQLRNFLQSNTSVPVSTDLHQSIRLDVVR